MARRRPGFVEVVGEPSTPELAARLAEDGVALAEGQVAEICLELEPWLDEGAARLDRGFGLILDYGYEAAELYGPRHLAGTLLGYRGHRVVEDPLTDPGSIDLTAHVDFTAVARLAERRGLRTVSTTTQSEFLVARRPRSASGRRSANRPGSTRPNTSRLARRSSACSTLATSAGSGC